jgi:hypothetical protein
MSDGIFTVGEERLTELEELNNALQDQVYVLRRDLQRAEEQNELLRRERDRLRRELHEALELADALANAP